MLTGIKNIQEQGHERIANRTSWKATLEPTASLSAISSSLYTLFSKDFSSFPHGTCSLSVSCQYLALDGIYHPLRDAFPSISTRREWTVRDEQFGRKTGLSPSLAPYSIGTYPEPATGHTSQAYNSLIHKAQGIFNVSSSRFTRRY